jgi:hypothetical protein
MTSDPGPTGTEEHGPRNREPLELRARPRRVTRINRKLLAGVIGLGLLLLAGLVMVALNPPSWRAARCRPSSIMSTTNQSPIAWRGCPPPMRTSPPEKKMCRKVWAHRS